jgi:di/tricarboxylate transporter
MTSFEKKFAAVILVVGVILAIIGHFDGTPFGMLMFLIGVMYVMFMYFSSNGDDDGNS